ncbi:hypothetical protein [Streptomyces sp. S584]|uniref:hypothetical protein n=1 Tax=Streptomyces sp. S584 TaxID=3096010 RepID=UPI002AFDF698|nr:hypothetical protein [Streptomyces sp. S584]
MRTTHTTRTGLRTLVALAALAAPSACTQGSDGTPGAAPATPRATASSSAPVDTALLEASVRAYVKAYYAPDTAAAYALLSTRCRKEWSREDLDELMNRAAQTAEQLDRTYTLQRLSVDRIQGDGAQVTHGVGEPKYDERTSWVREDGEWHNDLC